MNPITINNLLNSFKSLNVKNPNLEKTLRNLLKISNTPEDITQGSNPTQNSEEEKILKPNNITSEKILSQVNGVKQAYDNVMGGLDVTNLAEEGMNHIQSLLQEGRKLAVQASNSTLTDEDREFLNNQLSEIKNTINDAAYRTEYNEFFPLMEGTFEKQKYVDDGEAETIVEKIETPDTEEKIIEIESPKLDLVFIIDGSASMDDNQQNLADNINVLADKLLNKGVDLNYAVVGYGRMADNGAPYLQQGFTSDIETFKQAVIDVPEFGIREPGMSAIHFSADKLNFREGSVRSFIIITDEGANDAAENAVNNAGKEYYSYNGDISGKTHSESTIEKLKEKNITINGVIQSDEIVDGLHGKTGYLEDNGVITQTGGVSVDIDNSDWSNALSAIADNLESVINEYIKKTDGTELEEIYVVSPGKKLVTVTEENRKMVLHIGPNQNQSYDTKLPVEMRSDKNMNIQNTDISSREGAENTIAAFDNAINYVSTMQAYTGAVTNRLEHTSDFLKNIESNYLAGNFINTLY